MTLHSWLYSGRNPHEVVLVRLKDYDEPYRTYISNALESEFSVITNTGTVMGRIERPYSEGFDRCRYQN